VPTAARPSRALLLAAIVLAAATALTFAPTPAGLSREGHRVLAVVVLAIGLWATEALAVGVTSMIVVIALVASGAVPTLRDALAGFAEPVAYFLLAVLTIGLAVARSGLAERLAGAGGTLRTRAGDGRFTVEATLPGGT
jgi:sodium-dependent dicarboxylate transporter 2/3/5